MLGAATTLTVTTADPSPCPEPFASVTLTTEYSVVIVGLTSRIVVDVIDVCVKPSDQTSVHGGAPLSETRSVASPPSQIEVEPLTVAMETGSARIVSVTSVGALHATESHAVYVNVSVPRNPRRGI